MPTRAYKDRIFKGFILHEDSLQQNQVLMELTRISNQSFKGPQNVRRSTRGSLQPVSSLLKLPHTSTEGARISLQGAVKARKRNETANEIKQH